MKMNKMTKVGDDQREDSKSGGTRPSRAKRMGTDRVLISVYVVQQRREAAIAGLTCNGPGQIVKSIVDDRARGT